MLYFIRSLRRKIETNKKIVSNLRFNRLLKIRYSLTVMTEKSVANDDHSVVSCLHSCVYYIFHWCWISWSWEPDSMDFFLYRGLHLRDKKKPRVLVSLRWIVCFCLISAVYFRFDFRCLATGFFKISFHINFKWYRNYPSTPILSFLFYFFSILMDFRFIVFERELNRFQSHQIIHPFMMWFSIEQWIIILFLFQFDLRLVVGIHQCLLEDRLSKSDSAICHIQNRNIIGFFHRFCDVAQLLNLRWGILLVEKHPKRCRKINSEWYACQLIDF